LKKYECRQKINRIEFDAGEKSSISHPVSGFKQKRMKRKGTGKRKKAEPYIIGSQIEEKVTCG